MDFRGKSVIITGASSGIGEELAVRLARRGGKLTLAARSEAELARVAPAGAGTAATTGSSVIQGSRVW